MSRLLNIGLLLGLLLGICFMPVALQADPPDDRTRAAMQSIFAAVRDVLPLALRRESFSDRANEAVIAKSLSVIAENAATLGTHAAPMPEDYKFAKRSLEQMSREAQSKFARQRKDEARYLVSHITETCITCHSKVGSDNRFKTDLLADEKFKQLAPLERAALLTAFRQFDAAITLYEQILVERKLHPSDLMLQGAISDYLLLILRVNYDPGRGEKTLLRVLAQKDVPEFVAQDLRAWTASLRALPRKRPSKNLLALAKQSIDAAKDKTDYPLDRKSFVGYAYASGLLHEFVTKGKGNPTEIAEAYYLLGLTEMVIGRSFWLSETEFFLETAIRKAPKAKFAMDAYALIEEYRILEYSGSSGINIPGDVKKNLEELLRLIVR